MSKNYMKILLATIMTICLFLPELSHAIQKSKPLTSDGRIKYFSYVPDEVFVFTGHYRYQSTIFFDPAEKIQSISMGDTVGWMIQDSGNRLFLKPVEPEAQTHMTIITDKRLYLFELYAEEAEDIHDEEISFITKFFYPNGDSNGGNESFRQYDNTQKTEDGPKIYEEPEKFNFDYSISGSDEISPLKVFDDGDFTYIEFRDKNATIPAIFKVDKEGNEALINFHMRYGYIIIEEVASLLTLRYGQEVACIFNDVKKLVREDIKRRNKKFLGIF